MKLCSLDVLPDNCRLVLLHHNVDWEQYRLSSLMLHLSAEKAIPQPPHALVQ
jgi:hypothetical protein